MEGKKKIGIGLGAGTLLSALYGYNPEKFMEYLSIGSQQTLTRDLFLFSVAAWIHSWKVGKSFENVTLAIQNLGDALRGDLGALGSRVGKVEQVLEKTNFRVETLEKPNKGE